MSASSSIYFALAVVAAICIVIGMVCAFLADDARKPGAPPAFRQPFAGAYGLWVPSILTPRGLALRRLCFIFLGAGVFIGVGIVVLGNCLNNGSVRGKPAATPTPKTTPGNR